MRGIMFGIGLAAAFVLLTTPSSAQVIDCSGDCTETKYGLGHPDDRNFRAPFDDVFAVSHDDFSGSYLWTQSSLAGINEPECGPERGFFPYSGQVIIREQTGCVPSAEFPVCDSGDRVGEECNAPGFALEEDCPGGGLCDPAGGCPIELPLISDLGGGQENEATISSGIRNSSSVFELLSSSSPSFNGTSPDVDGNGNNCLEGNKRAEPAQGWRFNLPASRGGGSGETYLRFHGDPLKGLYRFDDNGSFCCTSPSGAVCGAISEGFNEYPDLYRRNCTVDPNRVNYLIIRTNDWIFDNDPALPPYGRFETDPEQIRPGQQQGLCRVNRLVFCEANKPNPIDPCPDLDATPEDGVQGPGEPGFVADECDLRERGFRNARPTNEDTDGDGIGETPARTCPTNPTVLRGVPGMYCTIVEQYALPGEAGQPAGDPGPDCGVFNFGGRTVPDFNCDGVDDREEAGGLGEDLCPFLNEYNPVADADTDCTDGDPSTPCRGDECECGDQTLDGFVNVNDILAINNAIFELETQERIADANNDLVVNVSDILGVNAEIFNPNAAECRHVTRLGCGNGIIETGEACDDGNVQNLDGCDTACQLE